MFCSLDHKYVGYCLGYLVGHSSTCEVFQTNKKMMNFSFLFQITFCSVAFHSENLVTLVIFIGYLDSAVIRAFWMPDSYVDVLRIQIGIWMILFITKPLCGIIKLLSHRSLMYVFNLKWVREKQILFVGKVWKIP